MSRRTRRAQGPRYRERSPGASRASVQRRRKPSKSRQLARWFALVALFLLLALGALFAWSVAPGAFVGRVGVPVHFEVKKNSKGDVIDELGRRGHLSAPMLTKVYALVLTPRAEFKPRAHLLSPGISARELVQRLAELGNRPQKKVTLPEGFTHRAMAPRFEEAQICSAEGFRAAVSDETLLSELKLQRSAEGYLFPASYHFLVDTDPRQVVRRMVKEARKRIAAAKQSGAPHKDLEKLGFGEAEIVTLASIVEKETSAAAEAPRVARVFLNRLLRPHAETKGRLQSDPTAAYGCLLDPFGPPSCRDFEQLVTPQMLADSENPYNTYRHAGLPPGPISNPGERALFSVLNPKDGNELYFVADGTGAHTFTETFAEHRKAVEKLRALKKHRGH